MCWHCVGHCYGKSYRIRGLKAPGNYSGPFWSNRLPILLLERPKPNISMISGFLDPVGPLFYGFVFVMNKGCKGPDLEKMLEVPKIIQKVLQHVRE